MSEVIESTTPANPSGAHAGISPTSTSPTATAQPGAGHNDFASAFEALREIGFDGYLAMESGIRGDPAAVLPQVVRRLRSLMG